MPDEEKNITNILNTGQKIITLILLAGGALVSVVIAYLKIFSTEAELNILETEVEESFIIMEDRADKRYERATQWHEETKRADKEFDIRMRQLEIDNAFNKGVREGLKQNK